MSHTCGGCCKEKGILMLVTRDHMKIGLRAFHVGKTYCLACLRAMAPECSKCDAQSTLIAVGSSFSFDRVCEACNLEQQAILRIKCWLTTIVESGPEVRLPD